MWYSVLLYYCYFTSNKSNSYKYTLKYMRFIFTHIFQGCFTGTGAIIWLPQYQWSNPEIHGQNRPIPNYYKIRPPIRSVSIIFGMYCTQMPPTLWTSLRHYKSPFIIHNENKQTAFITTTKPSSGGRVMDWSLFSLVGKLWITVEWEKSHLLKGLTHWGLDKHKYITRLGHHWVMLSDLANPVSDLL